MKYARDLVNHIDELPTRQRGAFPEIVDDLFWDMYDACKDFSMVHAQGFYNTYSSLRYIAANRIRGCAVECGCFLGGMAAFMGLARRRLEIPDLEIVLFDTFEGPPVGSTDLYTGGVVIETPTLLPDYEQSVRDTIATILGSPDGYRFVRGLVEDTIPRTEVGPIALLRLDTDFYTSTRVELEHLYPKLVPGGVLIVDDYGSFQGSRRAVDEYLAGLATPPLLNRIDPGIWAGVKPADRPSPAAESGRTWLARLLRPGLSEAARGPHS